MLSFRQKIILSYVIAILVFIAVIYPFANQAVKQITTKAMRDRSQELIERIQSAPNNEALIRRLKEQKGLIFFRVSVISDERKVLYDSHTKRMLGPRFSQDYIVDHPEVMQAFKEGSGYNEDYSDLLGQKFSYFAKAFDFHGKTYVMRTAFPYKYVIEITKDFEIGAIALATAALLLFSLLTWFIVNHLTSPIQQIMNAVKPYQEGTSSTIPEIKLKSANPRDDFYKLAQTLNSLNLRIKKHIDTLTRERNEKETILESLIEGVIAVERDGTVTYANNSATKFLGIDRQELLGNKLSHQQKCLGLLLACLSEKRPLTETLAIKREGQNIFLDIVAAPKKDESGAILVLQDKTSHYKLLEMRKDFIANASHELKTPITIIRGFAEALHDNPDLPRETTKEITGKMVRNCERMTNLIKDLLTLTDVENLIESRLTDCDLSVMLEQCCATIQDVYPDAKMTVNKSGDEEIHMLAERDLMELAFMNLIENAAKYSKPPADITVTLAKGEQWIEIRIADKGIGIPPADLEHIFERFYTVDKAHSRKMGGSGLGLSIVETIISKHFGKISVASELGKGTTFTILLPISQEKK